MGSLVPTVGAVYTVSPNFDDIMFLPQSAFQGVTGPTGSAGATSNGATGAIQIATGDGGFTGGVFQINTASSVRLIDLNPTLASTSAIGFDSATNTIIIQAGGTGLTGGNVYISNTASSNAQNINIVNQSTGGSNIWSAKENLTMINTVSNNQVKVLVDEVKLQDSDGNILSMKGTTFDLQAGTTGGVSITSLNGSFTVLANNSGVQINGAYYLPTAAGTIGQVLTSNGDGTTSWA